MTSSSNPRRSAGFSLIEVLATLAIIGLMAALVAPRFGNLDRASFDADLRETLSLLRSARQLALAEQRPIRVRLDTDRNALTVPDLDRTQTYTAGTGFEVTVPSDRQNGTKADILFFPDGMSSGGTLRLVQDGANAEILVHWMGGELVAAR